MATEEEFLRQCAVPYERGLATVVRPGRGIVPIFYDTFDPIFKDELAGYAYVNVSVVREPMPVLRDIVDNAPAVSLSIKMPVVYGVLSRKREPVEYLFQSDEPVAEGAPVVVDGLLAGVVVGHYLELARVVPIGVALDRIEFEELDAQARAAFCRAEGIRVASSGDSIHMEHLVYALGLIRDLDVCHRVAEEAGMEFPDEYDVPPLTTMPRLSKHVREGLDHAIRNRDRADETSLHDLFEGLFAVDCAILKILIDAGVEIPNPTLAGYASDVPTSDSDPFGVHKYARALCTVLAAKNVVPPLSIGLFAPWGAGKTSFMKAMSDRFEAINDLTRRNPHSAYRSDIVQLWFNTWHYTEQNLIASLADAVFEGLDTALTLTKKNADPEKVDEIAFAKRALEKQLQSAEDKVAASQKKLSAAENKVEQIDQEIDAIKNDERTLDEVKRAGVALSKEEGDRYARKAAKALGVEEKSTDELLKDVDTVWSAARKLIKSPGWWRIALLWIVGTVILAVIAQVPASKLPLLPIVGIVGGALQQLVKVITSLNKAREAKLAERIQEKEAAELRAQEAKAELQRADDEKQRLQKKLDGLSPRESMASFVRERRASGTYARQLSVAAEAHRDFRRLSAYVKQHDVGVGRIVLYIDDLDRCPEEKVVEVLHAVHLLLAFDLFVVVVAVDSKWLLHSLKQYSKAFSGRGSWRSTPLNYLEKIIQIPFTLDPMSETGYGNFIADLTRPAVGVDSRPQLLRAGSTIAEAVAQLSQQASQPAERSAPPLPVDPNPAPLNFSPEETAFMTKDLYGLMSSPRNTKRFANVYRLIRATLSSSALDALLDPVTKPYEPLMILVALTTNYPEDAASVLSALKQCGEQTPWGDCVGDASLRLADVPRPERLVAGFRPWISHVARFLIQTGDR